MKNLPQNPSTLLAVALGLSVILGLAQITPADDTAAKPYKILTTTQIPAAGGIDYVTADSVNRRVYVACGNAVSRFLPSCLGPLPLNDNADHSSQRNQDQRSAEHGNRGPPPCPF